MPEAEEPIWETEHLQWEVGYDEAFRDAVLTIKEGAGGDHWENLKGEVEAIINRPIRRGDPKTGDLKGLRGSHAGELVIYYEIQPELYQQSLNDKIDEVYLWDVRHHDGYSDGAPSRNRVKTTTTYSIRAEYVNISQSSADDPRDIQSICNEVIELECFDLIDEPKWDGKGVTMNGVIVDGFEEAELRSLLPDEVTLQVDSSGLFG